MISEVTSSRRRNRSTMKRTSNVQGLVLCFALAAAVRRSRPPAMRLAGGSSSMRTMRIPIRAGGAIASTEPRHRHSGRHRTGSGVASGHRNNAGAFNRVARRALDRRRTDAARFLRAHSPNGHPRSDLRIARAVAARHTEPRLQGQPSSTLRGDLGPARGVETWLTTAPRVTDAANAQPIAGTRTCSHRRRPFSAGRVSR